MTTAVGPAAFQARLKAMVDTQNQREKLLEAERTDYIAKIREDREQQSRARQCQQTGSKFYVKAEEVTWEIKAFEDQREATNVALNVLESKRRYLSEELFELQRERDDKRKFYDCEGAKIREFKLTLRDCESTVQTENKEPSDELEGESEEDAKINETETKRTRLVLEKEAIGRDVCSNRDAVGILEQRLHEALLRSGTKKRDLATGVDTMRAEITGLQTTERNLEDQVLQAITRRDKKKRELYDLECELAKKKILFYGGDESQNTVS